MKKLFTASVVGVIGLGTLWACDGASNDKADGGRLLNRRSASTTSATVNPATITLDEFSSIELGMTLDQVTATFGSAGEVDRSTANDCIQSRWWHGPPGSEGFAMIVFRDGFVWGKTQVGLS